MPRRVNMPGADELFRSTAKQAPTDRPAPADRAAPADRTESADRSSPAEPVEASGRVKHDEKMTVYLTSSELLAVEQARLQLRSMVGRNVDRGRLVRAALAIALDDLDTRGGESAIARRLEGA